MRTVWILAAIIAAAVQAAAGQTRAELANRFGSPQAEIFFLPNNVRLTAAYGEQGTACGFRIETREHSERAAPNLTDARFWTDSELISRLIEQLVPANTHHGKVESREMGLRVGEHMRIQSDDAVEITRIQRSRPLLTSGELPVADRLVKIVFKRPDCRDKISE